MSLSFTLDSVDTSFQFHDAQARAMARSPRRSRVERWRDLREGFDFSVLVSCTGNSYSPSYSCICTNISIASLCSIVGDMDAATSDIHLVNVCSWICRRALLLNILVTFLESVVTNCMTPTTTTNLPRAITIVQVNAALLVTTVVLTSRSFGNKHRRHLGESGCWIMMLSFFSVLAGFSLHAHPFIVDAFASHVAPLKPRVASFPRTAPFLVSALDDVETKNENGVQASTKLLIHWKGEAVVGYSMQLRHVEFLGALSSVLPFAMERPVVFTDALHYDAAVEMPDSKIISFNSAMQFVELAHDDLTDSFVKAAQRCSLVHAIYSVVAEADSCRGLSDAALENGGFHDVMVGGSNQNAAWCLRARHYGNQSTEKKARRYAARSRSMKLEREALEALTPMLSKFGGRVNLQNPDCKIYVFDGLLGTNKVLARRLATGPQVSIMDPNTRICVTNTPLCPISAFAMCNVAGVKDGSTILDPYAGSCATLLAAAMIAGTCRTVGIEIAHDGLVDRNDIQKDFETRGLTAPLALLQGDSTESTVRDKARKAIGGDSFDLIITDPPYGIRESKGHNDLPPLVELFHSLAGDRDVGKPLLKVGGKLVAFVPCHEDEELMDCLPTETLTLEAGLSLDVMREQPLNDKLSRWLVAYSCIR